MARSQEYTCCKETLPNGSVSYILNDTLPEDWIRSWTKNGDVIASEDGEIDKGYVLSKTEKGYILKQNYPGVVCKLESPKDGDGWFKGTSMHTGKIGVFPGNYMSPVNRTVASSSQPKVPLTMCSQAGRSVTIVSTPSPSIGAALCNVDPNKSVPICTGPAPSSPIPAAVVTAAHMPPGQHPKVLMHVTSQMTVNQARNAVRTAVAHNQDRPTAAITPIQSQNAMAFLPHLAVCPQPSSGSASATNSGSSRMGVAMGCAAASLTPPNISAASLEVDCMRPSTMVAIPVASGNPKPPGTSAANQGPACKLDKDCKRRTSAIWIPLHVWSFDIGPPGVFKGSGMEKLMLDL
ncbi:E3 ubiquitin-protein ligase SH3RF1 isoform 1 [Silurus asotus]|uniref:E3 ubiquitin-protein ligase SH3RF1 isoform 1 n=1 Tax=Silurus asotus TaxID=30991 RepID=A0AAD5FJR0_SILAS|nr:E3 ubiquitin-protein ligase SH3RF1 isoform 1 [Silurus asotus]